MGERTDFDDELDQIVYAAFAELEGASPKTLTMLATGLKLAPTSAASFFAVPL